jgi:hypothetical protein
MMIDDTYIGKALEENGSGLMEVLPQQLPRVTEENDENLCQNNRCPDKDSNRLLLEYELQALLLYHPSRSLSDINSYRYTY